MKRKSQHRERGRIWMQDVFRCPCRLYTAKLFFCKEVVSPRAPALKYEFFTLSGHYPLTGRVAYHPVQNAEVVPFLRERPG
jgi:hypothetical protein